MVQVHDELLIETAVEEMETVKRILAEEMEKAAELSVPLEIDMLKRKAGWTSPLRRVVPICPADRNNVLRSPEPS